MSYIYFQMENWQLLNYMSSSKINSLQNANDHEHELP